MFVTGVYTCLVYFHHFRIISKDLMADPEAGIQRDRSSRHGRRRIGWFQDAGAGVGGEE